MPDRQQVRLGTELESELVGSVLVEVPQEMIDAFDVVLAPVITIKTPGEPGEGMMPKISGWQLIPRTSLDIRPRDPNPPHKHIGAGPRT